MLLVCFDFFFLVMFKFVTLFPQDTVDGLIEMFNPPNNIISKSELLAKTRVWHLVKIINQKSVLVSSGKGSLHSL